LTIALTLRETLGERRIDEADLPITIGGPGCDVVLAGCGEGPAAHLGVHDGELFVQRAAEVLVLHNGAPVERSAWLHTGDVLDIGPARLRLIDENGLRILAVEDGANGNITVPPLITAEASISGESEADEERIEAIAFRTPTTEVVRRRRMSPARWVVLAVVALLGCVAWFIFTGTSVEIASEPVADEVSITGGLPAIEIGNRYLMRPGSYALHVAREGYKPLDTNIEVARTPTQRFEFSLEKLPGILRVDVPATALISVDGEARGQVPGDVEIAPGKHLIVLTSERYLEFASEIEIEGEGVVQMLTPDLEPAWAVVQVSSEPPGADVLVGGESRGVTPLTTEILAGSHPLELRLEGYKPWVTDLQVRAGEPLEIGPVRLGLPDGRLTVRTDPAGASVTVAGVYRGSTPLTIDVRPQIKQSIALARPGYESVRREVELDAGEARTLNVNLPGIFGEVTVRAQPADAELFVDNQSRGSPNQTLKLVATTHAIEIRKTGYETYSTRVTPRPGLPQVVETTLLTPAQARIAAIPKTVITPAGQKLDLMPVGTYTMGSPRREPGRRANEGQHRVELKRRFFFATRPVTNAEFRQFVAEHRSGFVGPNTLDLDRQPVVKVSWQQAAAYCNWLSSKEGLPEAYVTQGGSLVPVRPGNTGYRLPTEAEWEFAARYVDGVALKRYPWGDSLPVPARAGNFADIAARAILPTVITDYDDGYAVTSPVGSFPANALGIYDLGGNVAEWMHDYYTVSIDTAAAATDPAGPEKGTQYVIRGSSWRTSSVTELRLAARDFGDRIRDDLGFRIARYAE
jgi:formylglycine-generating enzyme required for sulfatase activity